MKKTVFALLFAAMQAKLLAEVPFEGGSGSPADPYRISTVI